MIENVYIQAYRFFSKGITHAMVMEKQAITLNVSGKLKCTVSVYI